MKIIAYYRVSTKKQEKSKLGLKVQKETVADFAARNNGTIIAEYTEVETGRNSKRPKLAQALLHCKMNKATLIISKIDRLSRNMAFTSALMDSDVDFIACDNPHANRLTIHLLAAMAEHEGIEIRRRTKDALGVKKAEGALLGSARPGHWEGREHLRGWKKGVIASVKARGERVLSTYAFILPLIQEMRNATPPASFEDIAARLNEQGYETSKGKEFNPATVWRIAKKMDQQAVAS